MPASQALLDDSEELKYLQMTREYIQHFFISKCEGNMTVAYCQAELDRQAFPNSVWERGKLTTRMMRFVPQHILLASPLQTRLKA